MSLLDLNDDSNTHTPRHSFWGVLADLWPSLGKVWPYMAWGLCLGVLCLASGRALMPFATLAGLDRLAPIVYPFERLLHHLGVGFFVSATAVLLYEWGAHYKEVLMEAHRLTSAVDTARDAISRRAVAEILQSTFSHHPRCEEISRVLAGAYDATRQLASNQNWSSAPTMAFALGMFKNATDNALHLAAVSADFAAKRPSGQDYHLDLPEPGLLADTALTEVIEAIDDGRYLVLSDIDSWNSSLGGFLKAHGAAVKRGARIQRLFKLGTPPSEHTIDVVTEHYALAAKWNIEGPGSYEIRYCDTVRFVELSERYRNLGEAGHVGVFVPGQGDDLALRFQVTQSDLSRFTLTSIARRHQLIQDFDELWPILDDPPPEKRKEFFLIQTIKYLERGGSYYVISDFPTWQNGGLAEFQEEALKAVRENDIRVKRVFAVQPNDDKEVCEAVLREHLKGAALLSEGLGNYEVKLCSSGEAIKAVGEDWHFGVFRGGKGKIREMLSETAGEGMSGFRLKRLADADRKRAKDLRIFVDELPRAEDRAVQLLDLDLTV